MKSEATRLKHGVDFEYVQMLWLDDCRLTLRSANERDEERLFIIGRIGEVGWTLMRDDAVRIISARRARKQELELYGH